MNPANTHAFTACLCYPKLEEPPPCHWLWTQYTGSFSKDVFSQGAEYQVFLGVFLMFLAFFHSKIWAKFHFGTFKPYD